jgi:hypothetical protein
MAAIARRMATLVAAAFVPFTFVAAVSPAVGNAAECGAGTIFDAPSNTCVAAGLPPPPPPPPPPGDLTPGFSLGVCAPIPFVALCTGI